jgi:hypothetical protein
MRAPFRRSAIGRLALAITVILASLSSTPIDAADRCKMTVRIPAANTSYTQQHRIDVGDLPGHQVRLFEIHRVYPGASTANCEGLKRVESWRRGYSDYIDNSGRAWGYGVIVLENGDQIFTQWSGTSTSQTAAGGSKLSAFTGTSRIIGGTGRYAKVRGTGRNVTRFNAEKNYNETVQEIEYWFEK